MKCLEQMQSSLVSVLRSECITIALLTAILLFYISKNHRSFLMYVCVFIFTYLYLYLYLYMHMSI
ncbi:uncharacterized protein V1516DRAFT_673472 [Lipomyces oligophaga]|uniref:uncharacterized protein n=1 Tax=Lipomyces oligophaga TaxID=45792 RepID=UPI0034CD3C63